MKLIDKDALIAEIEKLMYGFNLEADIASTGECFNEELANAKYQLCKLILSFIDTLEMKEVDLEKAIDDYIYTHDGRKRLTLELDWKYCNLTLKGGDEIIKFAKHFFELGIKAQKGE